MTSDTTNLPLADRGAGGLDTEDVVAVILADHEEMERLLRELRDDTSDRAAVLGELADLLVGHARAEEDVVYPVLERRARDVGEDDVEDEVEHGEEEHAEIDEALLELLELADAGTLEGDAFDEALEDLGELVHHHLSEEERNVLNPARELVPGDDREELGRRFVLARRRELDAHPGSIDVVRGEVRRAREEGRLG